MQPVQADEIQQEAQQALQVAKLKGAELEEAEQQVANAEKHARDLEAAGRGQEAMIAAAAANQYVCFPLLAHQLHSSDKITSLGHICNAVLLTRSLNLQHMQEMPGMRPMHLAGIEHHADA